MLQAPENGDGRLDERVEALASWVDEIAMRVCATEVATGDEKTAKELRRAIEAVVKHDPKLESRLTERVEVLMDRLGTLASAVSTTSAELARRDGEIAALRRELDQGSARIEAVGRDVSSAASLADVAKLREAIAERIPERPARGGEERLDRMEGRLALLVERIDTLAPTVTTATAGLAARDGELANLRQKIEQVLAEPKGDPRVAALAGRVDMLATELEATTGQLAARDEAVAALRVRIDDAYGKASAVISELQHSLATVSLRLGAVDELPEKLEQALEATAQTHQLESLRAEARARLVAVENDREAIATEIDRIAKALDADKGAVQAQLDILTANLARIEQSTATDESERRLDELASRLDTMAGDLTATVEATASRESGIEQRFAKRAEELGARLHGLSATVASTAGKLAALETVSSEQVDRVANGLDNVQASLQAELDGLTVALEHVRQSTAGNESGRMRDELSERIDVLAGELAATTGAMAGHENALRARIDDAYAQASAVISELQLSLGALLSRVGALEELPERAEQALQAHVSDFGTRMSQLGEASSEQADLLAGLGARIALANHGREGAREEIDKILDIWASDRSSLETRLDQVATELAKTGSGRDADVSVEEVTRLRTLVDGLQLRLAAGEREVAELRSAPDLGSRLGAVTGRLEAIERNAHGVFVASDAPLTGDGRFRLELRALELRAEQAETSAREDREGFLVQLERLASRIEWRLQRLEPEDADRSHDHSTPAGAHVVPFRGGAEV